MADISGLLARKYDILQQNADAQNRLSWAQSGLIGAQTQTEPMEAAARATAARGAGAAGFGQAALSQANALQVPGLAQSEIGERTAQAQDLVGHNWLQHIQGNMYDPNGPQARDANAAANLRWFGDAGYGYMGAGTDGSAAPGTSGSRWSIPGLAPAGSTAPVPSGGNVVNGNPMAPGAFSATGRIETAGGNAGQPRYDTGTSQVPGDGSPKVDSVSAKLAPGEAVLNAAAAEHLGRSTIDFLNAIGAHKMGLTVGKDSGEAPDKSQPAKGSKNDSGVEVSNQTGDPPGYAWGTPNVGAPPAPGQTVTSGTWTPQVPFDPRAATGITGVPRPQTPAKPQAYAKGTSNVSKTSSQKSAGAKSKAKSSASAGGSGQASPTLPPPSVMQALLAMGGSGGGMPPQGAPPMPMPMPQVMRGR